MPKKKKKSKIKKKPYRKKKTKVRKKVAIKLNCFEQCLNLA